MLHSSLGCAASHSPTKSDTAAGRTEEEDTEEEDDTEERCCRSDRFVGAAAAADKGNGNDDDDEAKGICEAVGTKASSSQCVKEGMISLPMLLVRTAEAAASCGNTVGKALILCTCVCCCCNDEKDDEFGVSAVIGWPGCCACVDA